MAISHAQEESRYPDKARTALRAFSGRIRRFLGRSIGVLLLACISGTIATAAETGEMDPVMAEIETLRQRVLSLLLGGEGDGESGSETMRRLDEGRDQVMTSDLPAIDLTDPGNVPHQLQRVVDRLQFLAEGYRMESSRHYQDPEVLGRVLQKLDVVLDHFNPTTPRPGSWYRWHIGIPLRLSAVGLILEEELPHELRSRLETALEHQHGDMKLAGSNAAAEARVQIYLALLQRDPDRLTRVAARALELLKYSAGVGVREDFSFLAHGYLPYAGTYGAIFAENMSWFLYVFDGTAWTASTVQRELLANLLLDHIRWFVVGRVVDASIMGRSFTHLRNAASITRSMVLMSRVETSRREELAAAAIVLLAEGNTVPASIAGIADELMETDPVETVMQAKPRGFRYWYSAEMGAYRGNGYHIGFRQFSRRVQDYEHLQSRHDDGEGGWNLAYGFTNILRHGDEWFAGRRFHPEIDLNRLPGTTSRINAHPRAKPWTPEAPTDGGIGHSLNFGTSEFSGGAGWEEGGVSAFILEPVYGGFTARKSYHFFPGGFWALGSDITAHAEGHPGEEPVNTTILQWVPGDARAALKVSGERLLESHDSQTIFEDVRWIWIDHLGCVFAEPTSIHTRWRDGVLTVWLDHGVTPQSQSYAYAVFPHSSLEETREFAADMTIRPIQMGSVVHAVRDHGRGADTLAFFESGTWEDITTDHPVVLYRERGDSGAVVAVQNPLYTTQKIGLTLNLPSEPTYRDAEVDIVRREGERYHLRIDSTLGRIYRVGFGEKGRTVSPVPRVDLAGIHDFRVEAQSDAKETILTVHLPPAIILVPEVEEPASAGRPGDAIATSDYTLTLRGHIGHRIMRFTEDQVIERPAPRVVRYRWDRSTREDSGESKRIAQRDGDFRLTLQFAEKTTDAYFSVPRFDEEENVVPGAGTPIDTSRPPHFE